MSPNPNLPNGQTHQFTTRQTVEINERETCFGGVGGQVKVIRLAINARE